MNTEQQRRAEILIRLEDGSLDPAAGAELLGIGARQVRRLRARYRLDGLAAVVHGNAGRSPANCYDPALTERIVALAGPDGKYHDLNVCHLRDLLEEEEQIVIARSTLDRLLKAAGVRHAAKPARHVHRRRRQRQPAAGMLLQIDGSPFNWLEERGPKATLMGAIDDATNEVVFLLFRPTEDQHGYLLLLRTVAQRYGLPMSMYHDRHTILRSPKQPTVEEQLLGQIPMSQIQRIMAELGIEAIPAHSPQAKGRIERLWRTLQDRLTKELRLQDITTLEAANAFLPAFVQRFNARFSHPPRDSHDAWVLLPPDLDLNYYFAIQATRKVRPDHCISYNGQTLQLLPGSHDPSLVNRTIAVHVVPEGQIYLYDGKRPIAYRLLTSTADHPLPSQTTVAAPAKPPDPQAEARRRGWLYAKH